MNTSKRILLAFVVVAGLLVAAPGAQPPPTNAPWYPSLQAFEHYDSGRSHVFSMATFDGSFFSAQNLVNLVSSSDGAYPSGYNMA